jgi:hypothetical protein
MLGKSHHIPRLTLQIMADTRNKYTTLLQSGIFVTSSSSLTIGELLYSLPGFTSTYITQRIETIFLNGLPVDDLEEIIGSSSPVLALSAAMPGLAGAIFRKNSFHAPLRTTAPNSSTVAGQRSVKVLVVIKFFNSIASERGKRILQSGCLLKSDSFLKYLRYRPQLLSEVVSLYCDDVPIGSEELESSLDKSKTVFLRIQSDDLIS